MRQSLPQLSRCTCSQAGYNDDYIFGTIEALYVFFSGSTQSWEKLKSAVPVVVKSESETRWSARTKAVKPINKYLEETLKVLQDMIDNEKETGKTRSDAIQLHNRMLSYDFDFARILKQSTHLP